MVKSVCVAMERKAAVHIQGVELTVEALDPLPPFPPLATNVKQTTYTERSNRKAMIGEHQQSDATIAKSDSDGATATRVALQLHAKHTEEDLGQHLHHERQSTEVKVDVLVCTH